MKLKSVLLSTLMALSAGSAWADVTIDATNFPDANFRNYLSSQSYGADGVITDAEIATVTWILVTNGNVMNLKGIEYFTALTELVCDQNQLTSLDVSKNTALQVLKCERNQLTSLDVSKNTALIQLWCNENKLSSLDVSKNMALNDFICSDNQLTSLDVSKNTELEGLGCNNNRLTSLNVSNNTKLKDLSCRDNKLTSLDVTKNVGLIGLSAGGNRLTSLDVSMNTALSFIECAGNQITSLDVSKNAALTELDINNNQITTLDVSKNTALTLLNCGDNQLASLDVAKNTLLKELYCNANRLASLDVTKNTALTMLYCYINQLTSLDVSQNTALTTLKCNDNQLVSLDVTKNNALRTLQCNGNQFTTLDVSQNTALKTLYCHVNKIKGSGMDALVASLPTISSGNARMYVIYTVNEQNEMTAEQAAAAKKKGWVLYSFNGEKWIEYEGGEPVIVGIPINEANFPDENFRNYLLQFSMFGQDGALSDDDVASVELLSISKMNIKSLKGIEYFTALKKLYCFGNQLTSLDVSKNTALEELDCYSNQLTSVDVSGCTALTRLMCNDNQLTALDVSKNTKLIRLQFSNNKLTALDVSKNTTLKILYFDRNQIKGKAMDALVESMPVVDKEGYSNYGVIRVIYNENEHNVMTTTQVEAVKKKGWTPMEYVSGSGWIEYAGSEPDVTINETNFPDENFRKAIAEQYGTEGKVTEKTIESVASINVSGKGIDNLKGIEYFTELIELNCSQNSIKGEAMDALIESLPNRITNAPNSVNGAMSTTSAGNGSLYVISNENEQNEMTKAQVAAATAKGWTPYAYNGTNWVEYEGTTAVGEVKAAAGAQSAGVKKYFKDGKLVIEGANGSKFDAAGAQVK